VVCLRDQEVVGVGNETAGLLWWAMSIEFNEPMTFCHHTIFQQSFLRGRKNEFSRSKIIPLLGTQHITTSTTAIL
jgi:hypothetical protein